MQARWEKRIARVLQAPEHTAADRARLAEFWQTLSDVCHQLQENQAYFFKLAIDKARMLGHTVV